MVCFLKIRAVVDFYHCGGVFHRDLKPENIFLDENENLKISDFCLSALSEHHHHDGLFHTQCGTSAYIAPEVLRKKGYDGSKAIWSFGVILYELLAGFLPFQNENMMSMYSKVLKVGFQYPLRFSAESRRLISKILVADPERRAMIPVIMRAPWFLKGFSRPLAFQLEEPVSDDKEL
ncbi:hypothetical protein K1719_001943 [Acacia pycnantha]|nr:hypothetical protein K1719_001943 [Acacia pycnantha]